MSRNWRILHRAFTLRCIACGARPVLLSWFRESPNCPRCGFRLDRAEDGYWLGSYSVNLSVTLFLVILVIVVLIWWEWPKPSWSAITTAGLVSSIVIPLVIFPWTKTFYLALDMLFRPPEESDFTAPAEPALRARQGSKKR